MIPRRQLGPYRPEEFVEKVLLKPNTHRRRRRDSTVELRSVGGVYWL